MEENKSKTPVIIAVVIGVAILVAGGVFLLNRKTNSEISTPTSETQVQAENTAASPLPSGPVKEFTVDGTNFAFSPTTITVNKGDTVKITFKDDDGTHDLVIDGYNARTNIIRGGDQDTVTFVADKTGSFDYYCSVGSHRAQGMVGTLTVN